jgi:hypothetical protein
MSAARPGPIQYIAYSYGLRQLPDSMREWVARDLAGPGAVRRFMVRAAIPPLVVLAPFWLLPVEQNSLYVHAEMTVPIYLWTLLMSLALNKVWRRHRLAVHGLDPGLADATRREKNAEIECGCQNLYGFQSRETKTGPSRRQPVPGVMCRESVDQPGERSKRGRQLVLFAGVLEQTGCVPPFFEAPRV